MEVTKLFFTTLFAAFVGVIPPGLVNMTVAKTCLEKGKKSGVVVAIGASIIVFCQAMLAILLAKYIFRHPDVQQNLLRVGLLVFIGLGVYFFLQARKTNHHAKKTKQTSAFSLVKGMTIAGLNVFPIPYFVTISAVFSGDQCCNFSWASIIAFSLAAAIGTFTTLYLYVYFFAKINDKTAVIAKYANYFMAVLMLMLVLITFLRLYI
ncbi:MAG: LysE family translocator [Mesonia hippocampi]|uniref:LysE family translocator n=1 Tax=Mesonia hippocampi TaxID=1628250 RepID=UPI003F98CB98